MDIDEKIKAELEKETIDLDNIMIDEEGILSMLSSALNGGMRRWVIFMHIIAVVIGLLAIWTGYHFFISDELKDMVFWGFCVLAAIIGNGFLKQWLFMEIHRSSVMREVKRVEVALAKLSAKLDM